MDVGDQLLDLNFLRAPNRPENEERLPDDGAAASGGIPVLNEESVNALIGAGFSLHAARRYFL